MYAIERRPRPLKRFLQVVCGGFVGISYVVGAVKISEFLGLLDDPISPLDYLLTVIVILVPSFIVARMIRDEIDEAIWLEPPPKMSSSQSE